MRKQFFRRLFHLRHFFAIRKGRQGEAERNADHVFHVWINQRQEVRRKSEPSLEWEHSLYEFKSMLQFLKYGHKQLRQAFEGKLRTQHRQCSRVPPEEIVDNKLMCCLGKEVTSCPILLSLQNTVLRERGRIMPFDGSLPYSNVDDEQLYLLMARTCAWHIYHDACDIQDGHNFRVDTSEGYLMDKSDRMFWDRVYRSMSQTEEL